MPTWDTFKVAAPLLDLREPDSRNTLVYVSDNATHSLNAKGPHVEVERRVEEGRATAMARITAPDGRVLNVCWVPTTNRVLAPQSLIEDLTSDVASKVLKKATEAEHREAARRVMAAMEAGLEALSVGQSGYDAWSAIRAASWCLSDEEHAAYTAFMPVPVGNRTIAMLRDNNIPPEAAPDFVFRWEESVSEWRPAYHQPGDYQMFGKYAARGWSAREYLDFKVVWRRAKNKGYYDGGMRPTAPWAEFPPVVASVAVEAGIKVPNVRRLLAEFEPGVVVLGLQAGMDITEIRRLVTSGEWDDDAVRMLAAFRLAA
jgi:hypothetical protein